MKKQPINPWRWQEAFGFSQGWRVEDAPGFVFLAGQGPLSPDGRLVGEGDFETQVRQTFSNIAQVLEQAGASMESVVSLRVYLTDIARLREYGRLRAELMAGVLPASTAIQVGALALPGMMIEVDGVALVEN